MLLKYLYITTLLLLLTFLFFSCQKNDTPPVNQETVAINISSPAPQEIFAVGDTVYMKASVIANAELHGYELKITDTVNGFILFDEAQHAHSDNFTINDTWTSSTSNINCKMELIVLLDHDGHDIRKTIPFHIK